MDFEHPNSWGYILMVNKIMLIKKIGIKTDDTEHLNKFR